MRAATKERSKSLKEANDKHEPEIRKVSAKRKEIAAKVAELQAEDKKLAAEQNELMAERDLAVEEVRQGLRTKKA